MNTIHRMVRGLALLALFTLDPQITTVFAQGTAFNYQGRLNSGTNLANGIFDFRFTVYDSTNSPGVSIAGPLTSSGAHVSNGLFSVTLDFGVGVFTGPSRWLQLDVRTNGTTSFATLLPRQSILPMPYAVMANTASNLLGKLPATQLVGNLTVAQLPPSVVTNGTTGVTLTGTFTGNGAGLTNLPSSGGGITWQNVTGTNQQAQPNTGYLANNAAQVTITLPTSPKVGDIVRVSSVGAGGWRIAQNPGQLILISSLPWLEHPNSWRAVASSSDGTKLIAGPSTDLFIDWPVYISTNSGATWTPSGASGSYWVSVASSSDGSKLVAAATDWDFSSIYTSANSGATWTLTSAPSTDWVSVASSTNGTKLVAATSDDSIYTSTNSGATWTQTSAPSTNWVSVASSSNGSKLVAAVFDYRSLLGSIYTSTNSGATWTLTSAPSTNKWVSVASSSDGSKLVAAAMYAMYSSAYQSQGFIYTSTNSGATWTPSGSPAAGWVSVASSSDGSKLVAASDAGIYTSANSGVTWTQHSIPRYSLAAYASLVSVALSSDGSKFVAVGDQIYTPQFTAQTTTARGVSGHLTGRQDAAIELQYVGSGQFQVLSFVGTITQF